MRKKTQHYPLIYARYLFHAISNFLIIVFAFIPNITFTLDGDKREAMSLFGLIKNTWYNSRVYLFSAKTQQTSDGALFYKMVFATLIVCALLFIIGTAFTVFFTVTTVKHFNYGDNKIKNLFTAIVPNRAVLLAFSLTLVPISFFPKVLVYFYKNLLLYPVSVAHSGISAGLLTLSLTVIGFALTIITRKKEILLGKDLFDYNNKKSTAKSDAFDEDGDKKEDTKHYSLNKNNSSSSKQLRYLLGLDEEDEKK